MLDKLFRCDRQGCQNTTRFTGEGFACKYEGEGWISVNVDHLTAYDFCSYECMALWVEAKIEEIRGGEPK
jgi:hypothetical protein